MYYLYDENVSASVVSRDTSFQKANSSSANKKTARRASTGISISKKASNSKGTETRP
jgi:hypothetical protein